MKTARERLAFRIAELLSSDFYLDILNELPQSHEELSAELEKFAESISGEPKPTERPTILDRLRDAVYADKGTPLKVVLESAISQCQAINQIRDTCDHDFHDVSSAAHPNKEMCVLCGRVQTTNNAT